MNELIKNLLAQAHLEATDLKDTNWIANRFAELIVAECADVARQCREDEWFDIEDAILEHFAIDRLRNINAGAEIHAGDGGYSIGTEEGHEQAARQRSIVLVDSLVGRDNAAAWWSSPNKAFNGLTPTEMWAVDYKEVHTYLMHHAFVGGGS